MLWLERGGATTARELRGVVEQSATSRRVAFRSGDDLLRILRAALGGFRSGPAPQLPPRSPNTTDEEGEQ